MHHSATGAAALGIQQFGRRPFVGKDIPTARKIKPDNAGKTS
jgi:hypothetical protein